MNQNSGLAFWLFRCSRCEFDRLFRKNRWTAQVLLQKIRSEAYYFVLQLTFNLITTALILPDNQRSSQRVENGRSCPESRVQSQVLSKHSFYKTIYDNEREVFTRLCNNAIFEESVDKGHMVFGTGDEGRSKCWFTWLEVKDLKRECSKTSESWDRNSIILFHVHVHSLDDVCHLSYREVKACISSTMGSWPMPTCGTTWVLTPRPLRRRWRRQSAANQGIYGIYIIYEYIYILYMCMYICYIYIVRRIVFNTCIALYTDIAW